MGSRNSWGWWAVGACLLMVGVGGAFLYWINLPDEFEKLRQQQVEIGLKNQQLEAQSKLALPHALPNAAPAASFVEGPAGKILPIRLMWRDEKNSSGGVLDDFGGCIMAGPGVDVFWYKSNLFVMKQKGDLRLVWNGNDPNRGFGHTGIFSSRAYVCYDGKYVWAPMGGGFDAPRLVILDPQTEQCWEVDTGDAPRSVSSRPGDDKRPRSNAKLALAPWRPGTVVAAGWPGHPWLAMLSFDPQQGRSVRLLPEPADLDSKRSDLLPERAREFSALGMWVFSGFGASDANARRLLTGRDKPPRFSPTAWLIDPEASEFGLVGAASLGAAISQNQLAADGTHAYWIEHAPVENPRAVLVRADPPDLKERVVFSEIPDGQLTFHEGWLWLLGDRCVRWKPGEEKFESIDVDVPWKFGFRREPADASPGAVRNDVYYSLRRAYPSQNYGLIVTTSQQGNNGSSLKGKFYQFGLEGDPRLTPEPSDDSLAGSALAGDAPAGTMLSLLAIEGREGAIGDKLPVAYLGPVIEYGEIPEDVGLPILAREIVRQSLLIAARDELSWTTRDAVLREASPGEPRSARARFVLSMRFPFREPALFELKRLAASGKLESVWKEELSLYPPGDGPFAYDKLTEAAERWSRESFPPLLKEVGAAGPSPAVSDAEVPTKAERGLEQLTFLAQFAALAELHDAIRNQGASPALTGALVRGYANLGVLTEFQWTAVHKACKARALLYAQRLAAADSQAPGALWHRAYAEALAGIHNVAQSDLAAAEKMATAKQPGADAAKTAERPGWVDFLAAYCRFEDEPLAAASANARYGQLADLLQFLAVEQLSYSEKVQQLMQELLERNPECFRVHDSRSSSRMIGTLHQATFDAPAVLCEAVPRRLQEMQDLPADAAKLFELDVAPEVRLADLADMLSATAPDDDREELSWRMLGGLIQETEFLQLWRRADFLRFSLAAPDAADEYVLQVAARAGAHRYHALLDVYLSTPQPAAAAELTERLDLSELDFEQRDVFQRMLGGDWETRRPEQYLAAAGRPDLHLDDVHRDMLAMLASFAQKEGVSAPREAIMRMRQLSPDSPFAASAWILSMSGGMRSQAEEFERKFAKHAEVWRALAYALPEIKEDQIRRMKKCVELTHEAWAYHGLARIYFHDGDYDQWKAVFDEYLQQPNRGLEHENVRVQIAAHFMRHNEWEKALPYALEAAGSWAEWAMKSAADCYDGLGDEKNEGLWRTRIAERYHDPENALILFYWSCRSGLGNRDALIPQLDAYAAAMAQRPRGGAQHAGAYYELTERPAEALAAYQKAAEDRGELKSAYTAELRAALVAHQLGDADARDKALGDLASNGDPGYAPFQKLGAWMQRDLAGGEKSTADLGQARELAASARAEDRPAVNYAIGRFLELRGRPDDANAFLDAAASSPEGRKMLSRVLASAALRARGQTPSKIKTEPIIPQKPGPAGFRIR